MNNSIFIVTTIFLNFDKMGKFSGQTRESTPGWYQTKREAEQAILENHGDMFEIGYYNYAVVEEIGPGLYPKTKGESWFEAAYIDDPNSNHFNDPIVTRIDKPDCVKHRVSFFQ